MERMGRKEQQLGFSNWERGRMRKQTRKEKFLYAPQLWMVPLEKRLPPVVWALR